MTLQEIEQSNEFKSLSYAEQQSYRMQYAQERFKQPDLIGVDPRVKRQYLNQLQNKAPVFNDFITEQATDKLGKEILSGDEKAVKTAKKIVLNEVAQKASLIVTASEKWITNPYMEAHRGTEAETEYIKAYQLPDNLESGKVVEYAEYLLKSTGNDDYLKAQKIALGGSIGIAEATALMMIGAGPSTAPRALGQAAIAVEKYVLKTGINSGIKAGVASVARAGTHAAITGSIGALTEITKEQISAASRNQDFQKAMSNSAKYFGMYFAYDLVGNIVGDILLPMTKSQIKNFTKSLTPDKTTTEMANSKQLIQDILTFKDLDPILYKQLPEEIQDSIKATRNTMKTLKDLPSKMGPDQAVEFLARTQGVNIIKEGEGYTVSIPGILKQTKVKTQEEAFELTGKILRKIKNISPDVELREGIEVTPEQIKLQYQKTGKIGGNAIKNPELISSLLKTTDYKIPEENAKIITTLFNKELSSTPFSLEITSEKILLKNGDKITKSFLTNGTNEEILENFTKIVKELAGKGGQKSAFRDLYKKLIKKSIINDISEDQLSHSIQTAGGVFEKKGGFYRAYLNSKSIVTNDIEELKDFIHAQTIDFNSLQTWLKERKLNLIELPSNEYVVKDFRGSVLSEGKTIQELISNNPEWDLKFSPTLAPKFTLLEDGVGVKWEKDYISGSGEQLLKIFDKYAPSLDKTTDSIFQLPNGKLRVNNVSKILTVKNETLNTTRTFTSFKEAKDFLSQTGESFEELSKDALAKGMRLIPQNGNYILMGTENKVLHSFEEIREMISQTPLPDFMPELSGLDKKFLDGIYEAIDGVEMGTFTSPRLPEVNIDEVQYGIIDEFSSFIQTTRSNIERLAKKGRTDVLDLYNKTTKTTSFIETENYKMAQMSKDIFSQNGKIMDRKKRIALGQYITAETDGMRELIKKDFKLSDGDIEISKRIRDFYGSNESGLFAYYGIKEKDFVQNYLPRIREGIARNKSYPPDGEVNGFLKHIFGENLPSGIEAFFKHQRVSDVVDLALDPDPLSQILKYNSIGLKEKYLNPLLKEVQVLHAGSPEDLAVNRMVGYFNELYGRPYGALEKAFRKATPKILSRLGLSPGLTNNIINLFTSNMYTATMAFRPWLPIRNSMQIWSTLAPIVGNDYVIRGLKKLDQSGDIIYDTLSKKGIIKTTLPIYASETYGKGGPVQGALQKGMLPFKHSDDFTRAVAYLAGSEKFEFLIKNLPKDGVDTFMINLGANTLRSSVERDIRMALKKGDYLLAKDIFSSELVKDTMFDYSRGSMGYMTRGTIGKLFGMMGTYPVSYTENIIKHLAKGTIGQRALFASTWIGNMTAIYAGFKAIGIEADSFLFWKPMIFTGGPGYELMNLGLQSLESGTRGKEARAKFLGIRTEGDHKVFDPSKSELLKLSVPGSYQARAIFKGAQAVADGDYYRAFLNFTSAPVGLE